MNVIELLDKATSSTEPLGFASLLWTRTRVFRCYNSPPSAITHIEAVNNCTVVRGNPHPDDSECFAHTVSVSQVPKSGGAVDVTWKYLANQFGIVGDGQGDDGAGDTQTPETGIMSMSVGQVLLTEWREDAELPSGGDLGSMMGTWDIGGWAIDKRGVGASRAHIIVPISVTIETPYLPNIANIRALTGRRNNTSFIGGNRGKVLYKGTSGMNRNRQGIWTSVHQFQWDDNYHLRQFPDRDYDNKIMIGDETTDYDTKAHKVFWYQPFPVLGNFGVLGLNVQV